LVECWFESAKAHPDDFSLGGDVLDMLWERRDIKARAAGLILFLLTVFEVSSMQRCIETFARTILPPFLGSECLTEIAGYLKQVCPQWQPLTSK
jgi:hypothetical protein